jgi:hypothetical protein
MPAQDHEQGVVRIMVSEPSRWGWRQDGTSQFGVFGVPIGDPTRRDLIAIAIPGRGQGTSSSFASGAGSSSRQLSTASATA